MFEFGCPVSLRLLKTYDTRMTSTSQDDNADIVEKPPSGGDEPQPKYWATARRKNHIMAVTFATRGDKPPTLVRWEG